MRNWHVAKRVWECWRKLEQWTGARLFWAELDTHPFPTPFGNDRLESEPIDPDRYNQDPPAAAAAPHNQHFH